MADENRRPMTDTAKSKVLRFHMPVDLDLLPHQLQNHFVGLIMMMDNEAQGVVNVGWTKYGEVRTEVLHDCMKMPKTVRKEVCFGDRLGKPHTHLRVSQWFERRFLVVLA